jgi:predicted regulator of Ras-like GTPase activity (Roadblock/LC7/MglB family)
VGVVTPRLKLAMEHDGPSRGRHVRDIIQQILERRSIRGALLVAPDGFVIAAEVPDTTPVEPLAAMAARLGRELEASAARMGRASFSTAMFSADEGAMFVAAAGIGYVVVLAEQQANLESIRGAVEEAVTLIQAAWSPPDGTVSAS